MAQAKPTKPAVVRPATPRARPIPEPLVFASGANHPGEIRGFARVGIAPGLVATRIGPPALAELRRLRSLEVPVFLDSGAFGEVAPSPNDPSRLVVVRPIRDEEWQARLRLYRTIGRILGTQLYAVAPDRVGSQDETLWRLVRWASEVRKVHRTGAHLLLALQQGGRNRADFYREAARVLNFRPVPAFPMGKAATSPDEVLATLRRLRPAKVHFLGLGIKNSRTEALLTELAREFPAMIVSLDSNLITASVGRKGARPRPLTLAQDRVRAEGIEGLRAVAVDPRWELSLDYTEAIACPSAWLGATRLRQVAREAALSDDDARAFVRNPEQFLSEPIHSVDLDGPRWWEDPGLEIALGAAWEAYVERAFTAPRKEQAILDAFEKHPAVRSGPWPEPSSAEPADQALGLFADHRIRVTHKSG